MGTKEIKTEKLAKRTLCILIAAALAVAALLSFMQTAKTANASTYTTTTWKVYNSSGSTYTKTFYHNTSNTDECALVKFVDISKYNGDVDFEKLAANNIHVIIRCAYQGYSSGSLSTDSCFAANIKAAKAAGLKVGVYIYTEAITTDEAVEQADYVYSLIKNYDLELPVVFDYEAYSGGRLATAGLSKSAKATIAKKFLNRMENKYGYESMLYVGSSFGAKSIDTASVAKTYPIWLARYNTYSFNESSDSSSSYYSGQINAWQCSSSGYVSGISGKTDINYYYDKATVSLSSTSASLKVDKTKKLTASTSLEHFGSYSENYTWVSSDTSVAKVGSAGKVTAKAAGTAKITATGKKTGSSATFKVTVLEADTPSAPSVSQSARTDSSVTLSWTKDSTATEYYVYRTKNPFADSISWSKVATVAKASYTDSSLSAGTEYGYKVIAANVTSSATKKSSASNTVLAYTSGLSQRVTPSADGSLSLAYKSGTSNKTVSLSYTKGKTYTAIAKAGNGKYYRLKSGKYIKVSAVSAYLKGASGIKQTGCTNTSIGLSWTAAKGDGEISYIVLRSDAYNGTYKKITTATGTSYTDTGLSANTIYYYKIRAKLAPYAGSAVTQTTDYSARHTKASGTVKTTAKSAAALKELPYRSSSTVKSVAKGAAVNKTFMTYDKSGALWYKATVGSKSGYIKASKLN